MDAPWFMRYHQKRRLQAHVIASYRTLPERLFTQFASNEEVLVRNYNYATDDWVSARFAPSDDHLLCLGGNEGSVALFNVLYAVDEEIKDYNRGVISCLPAHSGAVMGVYGVPNKSNELLSIGGDGTAKLFDMEAKSRIACFDGHDTIVRSASFAPESWDEFATCGRDGKFCLHDRRCQAKLDRNNMAYIPVRHSVVDAHCCSEFSSPGLTNIIYLDENTVITSSDKAISGIRFWDVRNLNRKPFRTLSLPHRRDSKHIGVASMDVNRFSSSLFVATTDSRIYEFLLGSPRDSPIRRLETHAHATSYDVTISASPVSDNLLSGHIDDGALLYNIPATHCIENDISNSLEEITPAFKLEGHTSGVTAVSWSCHGNYIVTLDDSCFRIWYPNNEKDDKEEFISRKDTFPAFQRAKYIGDQYEKRLTVNRFQKLMVSPIKSPFKSPVKKQMRLQDTSSAKKRKEFDLFCYRNDFLKNLPRRSNDDGPELEDSNSNTTPTPQKKKSQRNLNEFFAKIAAGNSVGPSELNECNGFSETPATAIATIPSSSPAGNTIKRYLTPLTRRLK